MPVRKVVVNQRIVRVKHWLISSGDEDDNSEWKESEEYLHLCV